MTICVNCGAEANFCLCENCRKIVDIEKFIKQISDYNPGCGENPLWDHISSQLQNPCNFKNIVFAIADDLPTPRKEYWQIIGMTGKSTSIAKSSRPWLYEIYAVCKTNAGLSDKELNRVRGIVLDALYKDYMYEEAEIIATELLESKELPEQVYMTVADFYTKTRRYEKTATILSKAIDLFAENKWALFELKKLEEVNNNQREKADSGKHEYMPSPKENREDIRKKYIDFLKSIGIEVKIPAADTYTSNIPKAIPRDQYPDPIETRDADFNSFVAFDIETTGFNTKTDSIIEIGAIKVINGQILEEKEFVFREFVKPFKRSVSSKITEITGITPENVKDARQMWEVIPDFLKFAEDMILVGHNSIAFDSKFLARAGRYSNIVITNKHFDVMRYLERNTEQLGLELKDLKLSTVSEQLGIENKKAHRAISDAVTTAKVFLKLKDMIDVKEDLTVDNLLADLDEW